MPLVTCQMSISLDGFVAGPDQSEQDPLGVHGMRVQDWHIREDVHPSDQPMINRLLAHDGSPSTFPRTQPRAGTVHATTSSCDPLTHAKASRRTPSSPRCRCLRFPTAAPVLGEASSYDVVDTTSFAVRTLGSTVR
jgi:hypothetical protein